MQSSQSTFQTLLGRIRGHQLAALIQLAARCDLADRVGARRLLAELAAELRCNQDALRRMVRALSAFDIFAIDGSDVVTQTAASRFLMKDSPSSLHAAACFWGLPCMWETWGELEYAVRSGECAFEHGFRQPLFDYFEGDPEASARFNRFMAASPDERHSAVVSAYDFTPFGCVADIGGGNGMLLARVLAAAPQARGLLCDRAEVVAQPCVEFASLRRAGRCDVVAANFFEGVPAGADAYILSQIIHDWDDEHALQILRHCRHAVAGRAALLPVERVLDLERPGVNANNFLSDIEMLVLHKAAERTMDEYRTLLREAGFRVERLVDTASPFSVIECRAS